MGRLALRERLAVSFTVALVLAYLAIAICAVLVVNRALSGSIDGRLATVAQAIVTIAGDGRDEIDRKDRQQFASITSDASGALVLAADGTRILSTTDQTPDWATAAIGTARIGSIFTRRVDGRELRVLIERRVKHDANNVIVVWQSMQIVRDLERSVMLVLGGFGLAIAIGGYAIGAQIARRGLLPLTRMGAVVADIAASDLDARVGPQGHDDEVGRLAATFDRMLDRLQAAFERQRRFTADASHDLRAPLATLRAEVDLALRRERTPAEYRAALAAIAEDADALDRLIDALLAAARSEGAALDVRPLELGAVAQKAVDEIRAFAHVKGVAIETRVENAGEMSGDADLLGRAILATLHNAVKYTPPARAVHVTVRALGGSAELRVRDEGPGFSAGALQHAFDRFWRDDAARARSTGSGLGLAIAGEIVQRCGGAIAIDNAANGGGEVIMRFPNRAAAAQALAAKPAVRSAAR